jgi:predicted acylesterase/phospholipase RssA
LLGATAFFDACLGAFQGGGCRAAAYAGAVRRADEAGVRFTELAGTSAGSIVAALLGAGATPDRLEALVSQRPLNELLSPPTRETGARRSLLSLAGRVTGRAVLADAIAYRGAHSTDMLRHWVNEALVDLLPDAGPQVRFEDLLIPTWIVATDVQQRRVQVWSTDTSGTYEVAEAVAASCALPFFFQPVQDRYIDGGALSNLPAFVYANRPRRTTERVLAFTLRSDPPGRRERGRGPISGAKEQARVLAETLIDGSTKLQLGLQPDVSVIEIPTGDVKATDFTRMTPSLIRKLVSDGADATDRFFRDELHAVRSGLSRVRDCESREETLAAVAAWAVPHADAVDVAASGSDWVFELFPALLRWRRDGVRVRALLRPPDSEKARLQHDLLRGLGAEVRVTDGDVQELYLRDSRASQTAAGVVGTPAQQGVDSMRYSAGGADGPVIAALADQFDGRWQALPRDGSGDGPPPPPSVPDLVPVQPDVILSLLERSVSMYRGAFLSFASVPIASMVPLARTVPLMKYRQAAVWPDLFRRAGLRDHQAAAVRLDGGHSLFGPPVVEASGGRYYVIQGTARALLAKHRGQTELSCVVVEGASQPLPAAPQDLRRLRVVVDTGRVAARFADFDYSRFRPIERSLRTRELLAKPLAEPGGDPPAELS